MWGRVIKLLTYACLVTFTWGHGLIKEPMPRNTKISANYDEHSLSAGGVAAVHAGGDPYDSERKHEGGGGFEKANKGYRITAYQQGSTMNIVLDMRVGHAGFNEFKVCPVPNGVEGKAERQHVTQACFDKTVLQRADGKGTRFYFERDFAVNSDSVSVKMAFKLPASLTCKRCVLQWHWVTGNSCTAPGTPPNFAKPNLQECGKDGANPEEFWNCADINIVNTGGKVPAPINGNGTTVQTGDMEDTSSGNEGSAGGEGGALATGSGSAAGAKDQTKDSEFSATPIVYGVIAGSVTAMPLVLMGGVFAGTLGGYVVCIFVMLYFMNNTPPKDTFKRKHHQH